jgi:DNA-binding transcriptional ArsR family regulator
VFADEIRRAIEAADRITLPSVTALLWRAYGEGNVTEAEAETLSGLIEARTDAPAARRLRASLRRSPEAAISPAFQDGTGAPRTAMGSRPRTEASLERRRRWAASGRLPPGLAARFTLAEQAVLALVATETSKRGDCRLAVGQLAAVAGVADTTVRNALREAKKHGLVTVEERRVTGFRNDTNVVRIVSPEWQAWMRLARKPGRELPGGGGRRAASGSGGGCKSLKRTSTGVIVLSESGTTEPSKGCRGAAVDLDRSGRTRIRAGRGTGRAMR